LSQIAKAGTKGWLNSRGRAFLYAFLSAVFSDHLTSDKIHMLLHSPDLGSLAGGLADLSFEEAGTINTYLQEIVTEWTNAGADQELEVQKEFARLFLLPEGVHPYESVYLGKKKLLMDKPWERVRAFYRSLDLEKDPSQLHTEDHIAVELGFMASMAYMSAEASGKTQKDLLAIENEFLLEHLGRWGPVLASDIRGKCHREQFYFKIAQIMESLLALDKVILHVSTDKI
jgi:putative dimethyl sulfoxide reductase chaperone